MYNDSIRNKFMTHPLTDEICRSIAACYPYNKHIDIEDCGHVHDMRAAYDLGYAQALEDVQDIITCVQRKDSPPRSVTLEELEAMRPQEDK